MQREYGILTDNDKYSKAWKKIEILRILDTYSNEDEATKQRIANALLDLSEASNNAVEIETEVASNVKQTNFNY